jgi:probable F420-dependent oxidoreductase
VEVGIGAGWMGDEFDAAGIPFDPASTRIERLEEAVIVLKGLFDDGPFNFSGRHFTIAGLDGTPKPAQTPRPPVLIGGGGPKLLAAAARQADIVQVLPGPNRGGPSLDPARITPTSFQKKIDWIRDIAGERFDDIELGTMLLNVTITDDVEAASDEFLARFVDSTRPGSSDGPSRDDLLASPLVAIGSQEEVSEKLLATRDTFGFSYFVAPVGVRPESLAPVIERIAGQ